MTWDPEGLRVEVYEQFAQFLPKADLSNGMHARTNYGLRSTRRKAAIVDQYGTVYESIKDVTTKLSITSHDRISRMLRGVQDHRGKNIKTVKGYVFKYLEEE